MARGWLMLLWLGAPAEPLVPQQHSAAHYELEWSAPPGCPGVEEVRAQIDAMAEEQAGAAGTLHVQARVAAGDQGFKLELQTTYAGQVDDRTLEAGSCQELADAASLVVALSLDPHAEAAGAPAQPRPRTAPEQPPEPSEPKTAPKTTPPGPAEPSAPASMSSSPALRGDEAASQAPKGGASRLRPRAWGARLAPFAEFGLLPGWSGGPSMVALALWDRWSFEVRGSFEVARRTARRDGARGRMRVGSGAARACWRLRTDAAVEFPLCGVLEAGRARAVSEGLVPEKTVFFAQVAPGVGAGLAVRGRRVGLLVGAESVFPLQRAAVRVGENRVFASRSASFRGIVGLEIFFATDPT